VKLAIVGNLGKEELFGAVRSFLEILRSLQVESVVERDVALLLKNNGISIPETQTGSWEDLLEKGTMLVTFGGDGTLLGAAHMIGNCRMPILGINLGKLGFLAEVAPSEMKEAVMDLREGRYFIEERTVLRGDSEQLGGRSISAVNDIVVAKGKSSRIISLEAHVNDHYAVTYRGDGLIVSTPTGSTAYALSNGGPIVTPQSKVLGLTPISPHSLSGRPLIIPDDSVITVRGLAEEEHVLVSADGQEEIAIATRLELRISKADYKLRLIKRTRSSFFDVLRAKLFWGRDPRSQ